jgi:hypothetical protein
LPWRKLPKFLDWDEAIAIYNNQHHLFILTEHLIMHPVYEIPPPIGWAPSTNPTDQTIQPPIGGSYTYTVLPPIGSTPVHQTLTPPIGSAPATMVPSQPMSPPIGSEPATLIASQPIQPPIGGPVWY